MEYQPDFKTFKKIIKKEKSYIIYTTLVADLDTPVSAMLRIGEDEPYSFLLESVEGGEAKGCLLYTSPSPRDKRQSRMPSSA